MFKLKTEGFYLKFLKLLLQWVIFKSFWIFDHSNYSFDPFVVDFQVCFK